MKEQGLVLEGGGMSDLVRYSFFLSHSVLSMGFLSSLLESAVAKFFSYRYRRARKSACVKI